MIPIHIRIKTDIDNVVHLGGMTDSTLCGLEISGDSTLSIEPGIITMDKITCDHCIYIIKLCKLVKTKEYV